MKKITNIISMCEKMNVLLRLLNTIIAKGNTNFYIYPNETGLSIYPVWWDFEYLIIDNKSQNSYLFYGAAFD